MNASLETIPAETRWAISSKALLSVMTAYQKTMYDMAGPQKYNEIVGQIWTRTAQSAKQIADALGIRAEDAESAAGACAIITTVALGPEFQVESIESRNGRTTVKITGCPAFNRLKEFGITDDLLTAGDTAYYHTLTRSLHPDVTMVHTRRMHLGDPYCEWTFETKK
jgi:hypothetical protein